MIVRRSGSIFLIFFILAVEKTKLCDHFGSKASMAATAERKVEVFDTEEEVAVSLAKYIADLSDKFCKEREVFTIVLSGGSLIESLR
jgi:hypothetical protein